MISRMDVKKTFAVERSVSMSCCCNHTEALLHIVVMLEI